MQADLQKAVEALYDAVVAPESWATALHGFARATNSVGCLFYPRDQARALVHLPVSPDIKEFIDAYVNEGWYRRDVRAIKGWPILARSRKLVFTDDDFTTPEERRSSSYFQELHRDWKLPNWAAIAFKANGGLWAMPLLRSKQQGSISRAQARALASVSGHLGRVVELATLLDARRATEHIAMLHLSGAAAGLLDWRGNVTGLTPAAEAMLDTSLYLRAGALAAWHGPSDAALQQLIQVAVANKDTKATATGIAIERPGRRPVVVKAIPLTDTLASAFGRARALLLFTDLDKNTPPISDTLRTIFGLTPAESRLAIELTSGNAIDDAAERLGIAKETARNQLKAIFRKVNINRQSELVALLARLPTPTVREDRRQLCKS